MGVSSFWVWRVEVIGVMGGGVIWLVVAYRRGSFTKGFNLYACPAGASLQSPAAGRSHQRVAACTARRRGVPFTRVKGTKTRLGLCPKTPVAGWAGYGLIFDGSPKSIRTAHRIAPKVACGSICPFPPPPFPRRERGPDGLAITNRQHRSRGVRACKNRKPLTLKYSLSCPLVPLL